LKSIDDHVFVMSPEQSGGNQAVIKRVFVMSPEQSAGNQAVIKRVFVMSPNRFDHGTMAAS